jgi:hypothetical protein
MPYYEVEQTNKMKRFIFGKALSEISSPDVNLFLESPRVKDHMNELGRDGWEMISVQQVLRGMYEQIGIRNKGFGYSLTAGYVLFWKRAL